MARLLGIRIQNFKSLADVTLGQIAHGVGDPLPPFLCFIGPNGSGKSTLLDAFAFVADALRGSAKQSKLRAHRQDSICGTWEVFQAVIAAPVEDKVGWAERIGPHLGTAFDGPNANKSPSFRQLCLALRQLAGEEAAA